MHERPKKLPALLPVMVAGLAGLQFPHFLPDFSRAVFTGRGGSKTAPFDSSRHDHGPGRKLARRIRSMAR